MTRSGYMLRQEQAMAHRSAAPCPDCGHPIGEHREYPTDDPRYRPLVFRCPACDCEATPRRKEPR